jgi:hypothetical protein
MFGTPRPADVSMHRAPLLLDDAAQRSNQRLEITLHPRVPAEHADGSNATLFTPQ